MGNSIWKETRLPIGSGKAMIHRSRHPAFTLIELLVVIAVIALVAAILFPVFAQVREKARSAACLSNNRQLGTAVRMYLQDYDGAYPLSWFFAGDYSYGFDVALFPYVRSYQVYECSNNKATPRYWESHKINRLGPIPASYALNADMTARGPGGERIGPGVPMRTGLTETAVLAPADTVLLAEIGDVWAERQLPPPYEIWVNQKNDVCERVAFGLHQGGSHYLFCDGHAEWRRVEATWKQWLVENIELVGNPTVCDQRRSHR